jgi:hypothetical protein
VTAFAGLPDTPLVRRALAAQVDREVMMLNVRRIAGTSGQEEERQWQAAATIAEYVGTRTPRHVTPAGVYRLCRLDRMLWGESPRDLVPLLMDLPAAEAALLADECVPLAARLSQAFQPLVPLEGER